jgi:hypothetical protein
VSPALTTLPDGPHFAAVANGQRVRLSAKTLRSDYQPVEWAADSSTTGYSDPVSYHSFGDLLCWGSWELER